MALDRQTVVVPLAGGIDSKTDPKQVQMGKLLELTNGVYSTPGTIRKRRGNTLLGTVTNAQALLVHKDELLTLRNDGVIYGTDSTGVTSAKGFATPGTLEKSPVARNTNNNYWHDSAYLAGYRLFTWYEYETTSVKYSVVQESTGNELVSGTAIVSANSNGRCIALGTKLILVYNKANAIVFRMVDTSTTISMGGETALVSSESDFPAFDVCVSGAKVFVAYDYSASNIGLAGMTQSGVVDTPVGFTNLGSVGSCLTVFPDSAGNLAVIWTGGTNLHYAGYSAVLGALKAPTSLAISAQIVNATGIYTTGGAGRFIVMMTSTTAGSTPYFVKYATTSSAWTLGAPVELKRGVVISGKASYGPVDGGLYIPLSTYSALQKTHFLYNGTTDKWVARWNYGTASIAGATYSAPLPAPAVNGNVWGITCGVRSAQSVGYSRGVDLVTIDQADATNLGQFAALAESIHVQGAQLWQYDGRGVVEHGFLQWPEGVTLSSGTGVGSVYGYQVVYSWTDNQGRVHRSAPSEVVQYTTLTVIGGGATCTVTIPRLWITNKTNVVAEIYRTEANDTIYKRVGTVACGALAANDSVTFADANTDATISANPQLYTTGGVLENGCSPACLCPTVFGNRVWVIDAEDRNTLRYSKTVVAENGGQGSPVEFVDSFLLDVPEGGGDCTALGVIDEKLIVFKKDRVFIVTGNGPNDLGGNDDLVLSNIQVSVGCEYPKSVVGGASGLFFQGPMGITKLDRSLQATFIGYDVSGDLGSNTVVAATVVQPQNQIRFALNTTKTLVYDYLLNLWSTFTHSAATLGQVIHANVFTRLDTAGSVYKESASLYTDNAAFVTFSFKTSWLQLAKLLGFQRVRRALLEGDGLAAETLNLSVYLDFDAATPVQTFTDLAVAVGNYRHRFDLTRQKCSAMQVYVYDTAGSTTNGAISCSALMFEAGVKRGSDKMPTTKID